MAVTGARTVGSLVAPGEAEAHHFCGHTYTTDSCPPPPGLPPSDARGRPLRARDGHRVDDLGRLVNADGAPVDGAGVRLTDAEDNPLPAAPRTPVCKAVGERYGFSTQIDGAWYRCCGGHVPNVVDCCPHSHRRLNGAPSLACCSSGLGRINVNASLTGYCYKGRRVFCVMYFQTKGPCWLVLSPPQGLPP